MKWFAVRDIPIIINNFNRLTMPRELIRFLETCGFTRIIILDNNSSYPPLLDFYTTCNHPVIRLRENYGHLALWESGVYRRFQDNYFVYTDSDVVPVEECPKDFLEYFKSILDRNFRLDKVGFGIKIDDLPDSFSLKKKVVDYESRYWTAHVQPGLYDAPIDTTFALYRPFSKPVGGEVYTLPAYRLGPPYLIRHLPWYVDSINLSEEEKYYVDTCNNSSSTGQHQKGNEGVY